MLERIADIISKTFAVSRDRITADTGRKISEKWDSLGQINLVLAIESEFGVRFTAADIAGLDSVRTIMGKLEELGAEQR